MIASCYVMGGKYESLPGEGSDLYRIVLALLISLSSPGCVPMWMGVSISCVKTKVKRAGGFML